MMRPLRAAAGSTNSDILSAIFGSQVGKYLMQFSDS